MTTDELTQTIEESGAIAERIAGQKDPKTAALWMIVKMLGVIALELRRRTADQSSFKA
jgi:hypothetical protein